MSTTQWTYDIQPAEQTPEVRAQVDAVIRTSCREARKTLTPVATTGLLFGRASSQPGT